MPPTPTERALVAKFYAKAGCHRPGAQRTAKRLWRVVKKIIPSDEVDATGTAWGHVVVTGEGRGDLDGVWKRVREKLGWA